MKSCDILYLHLFSIVKYGKNANYNVIPWCPYMRHFQVILDWYYNYLYLRQESLIIRLNLRNHKYRDVRHSPIEDLRNKKYKDVTHSPIEDFNPTSLEDIEHTNHTSYFTFHDQFNKLHTLGLIFKISILQNVQ